MWLRERARLLANRHRLAVEAAARYPDVQKLAGTPLLTRPEWVPGRPVPLTDLPITSVPSSSGTPLPPGPVPDGHGSYSAAMAALDAPAVFENRPTYRLLSASLREPLLVFGPGTYFDGIDTGEAAAHEYAAGGPTPLRDAIGDPTDLARRPVNLAISALTIRAGTRRTFFLHWRDPAKVGHAGGLYQVVPVGVFQASGPSPEDFSLWNFMLREYAEELLGEPERSAVDYPKWPFARAMTSALRAGRIRANCLGLGVDPLTFATDLLVSVEIDAPVFDAIFGARVAANDEGSVTEQPFTAEAIDGLPMQAAGAALVRSALDMLADG
ncbi:MAG: transcriptional regulator [Actinophytocola sp.]|uniref:hypothetical protein n=1 Tax=Actinophytocola sp. TaxID=1872138 RepID=UPI00132AC603|nr:hypothetical protein [Actinophytocola sp.]MPZ85097.1 transcriptional regulator [Actinophytocola sp.]